MNEPKWKSFLKQYNDELLSYEEVVEALPRKLIKAGWLGFPGATEAEIVATEKRLKTSLPPSYRAFLKTSNGWRFPSVSIFDLFPAKKIAWFSKLNQEWIDAYVEPSAGLPPVPDKKYFVYGAKQDCVHFRVEYLQTALQVSEDGDSAVVLLNPQVVTPEGEWETWFFANWLPGAVRYRTFGDWLAAARQTCKDQLQSLPKAEVKKYVTAKKPVSVKKAQAAARNGQTDVALESLEAFAAQGDDSAAASLAELYAFLGQWDKTITYAGRLIANPRAVYAGNVFHDQINLLGRAGHRSGEWSRIIEVVEHALKMNATLSDQLRREQPDKLRRDIITDGECRNEKVFHNLIEYAKRKGKPPHELLAIFGVSGPLDHLSRNEREARYWEFVANVDTISPRWKNDPQGKIEYLFTMAKGECDDEALRLYEAHGDSFAMKWQNEEYAAPLYIQRGQPDRAWQILEANLKHWWPVDPAQVAPVILLIHSDLEKLMTPDRCALVLRTPRGPEGAEKG